MKKLLSLLLAVAMIICALPLSTITAIAETVDIDLSEIADVDIKLPTLDVPKIIAKIKAPGVKMASLTAAATPDESGTTGDCTWELYGTKLVISGNGKMGSYSDTYYNGSYITTAPWGKKNITEVEIKDGVTSIGYEAFYGCTGLTSIKILDSVTSIGGYAFRGCTGLEEIYYNAKSVFSVDSGVFYNAGTNGNGIDVVFGDSVEKIPTYLFYGANIKSAVIGENVTSIGDYAFYGCKGLEKIYYNAKSADDLLSYSVVFFQAGTNGDGIDVIFGDSVEKIPAFLFYVGYSPNRPNIKSVTIGKNVVLIGASALTTCTNITGITVESSNTKYHSNDNCLIETATKTLVLGCKNSKIPADGSVTVIGSSAFDGCTGLTSIMIPDSVTEISRYAFYGCTGLTSIIIPKNVVSIGEGAFSGCTGITSITVEKGNKKYHSTDNCLIETATKTLISCCNNSKIPTDGSVTSIGRSAFDGCTGLTSIVIPDCVTSIGDFAFNECYELTSIKIGKNVTSIGPAAFQDCNGLTSIVLPDSLTSIGAYAFISCYGLTSITIGKKLTSIGDGVFSSCYSLETVYYKGTEDDRNGITIGFDNDRLKNAEWVYNYSDTEAPDESGTTGDCKWELYGTKLIISGKGAMDTYSETDYNDSWITSAPWGKKSITEVEIKDGVTSIGDFAFYGCTGLTSVTIPDSVSSIGDYAFAKTAWLDNQPDGPMYFGKVFYKYIGECPSNFVIKDGTTQICGYAFSECTGLKSITIPDSVTSLGWGAFEECTTLTKVKIGSGLTKISWFAFSGCTGLTSLDIPDTVVTIYDDAFDGCTGLKNITIGKNVEIIADGAFWGCTAIEKINYNAKSVAFVGTNAFGNIGKNSGGVDIIFGDSVETIPNNLLYFYGGYPYIKSVTIGKNLTSIGQYAFYGLTGLEAVYYKGTESDRSGIVFGSGNDDLKNAEWIYNYTEAPDASGTTGDCTWEVTGSKLVISGDGAIGAAGDWGDGITEIEIGEGVTSISAGAFAGCESLVTIKIPETVTSFGAGAFSGCTGLESTKEDIMMSFFDSAAANDDFDINCDGVIDVRDYVLLTYVLVI